MRARPWAHVSVPASVSAVPAMLSREECQYLIWLTSERFAGWGAVVDLGPWLGGSTAALAEGLRRRGRGGVVHSLDLFRWEPDYMGAVAAEALEEGADFQHVFARHTEPWASLIRARQADLTRFRWDGGPIELLFVDAAKTWELANAILAGFGDHLVPGRSRVVLQDFRYHETHWLPLIFDSQPEVWREVEAVRDGWTVTFELLQPLRAPDRPPRIWSDADFPLEVAEPLLRHRMATEHPDNAALFLRMLYRRMLVEGAAEETQRLRQRLLATGIARDELARIEDVAPLLVPAGWEAYDRGDFRAALAIADRAISGRSPAPIWGLALRGMALLRLGDPVAAAPCLEEVASRVPDLADAWLYLADLALASGSPRVAEGHLLHALALGKDWPDSRLDWAFTLLASAWRLTPADTSRERVRADLGLRFAGRRALHALQSADALPDPRDRERGDPLPLAQGWSAFDRGEYAAAREIAAGLEAGEDGPSPANRALLGMSLLRLGDVDAARPILEALAERSPGTADVWMYLAELHLTLDDVRQAEGFVWRALELGRHWPDAMLQWALSMLGWIWSLDVPLRQHPRQLATLTERFGHCIPVRLLQAQDAAHAGAKTEAMALIDSVLAEVPDHGDALALRCRFGPGQEPT